MSRLHKFYLPAIDSTEIEEYAVAGRKISRKMYCHDGAASL